MTSVHQLAQDVTIHWIVLMHQMKKSVFLSPPPSLPPKHRDLKYWC